eukprot:TRINITY_DN29980_c0_g1_i1.p1 TRINITY_DN29980_c0_g1~~TRINITY_DN29980_c0_g1_i1.p1  ORF type:complete len:524 (+),score=34.92 TRINITY_DN29980_c0_g1_i1:210-1781(+)
MAEVSASTTPLCSPQSFVLLCVLPSCNICGFLWCYTALPLHFVDSGWSLLQLSLLLTLVYVPRVFSTTLVGRVGDWLFVIFSTFAAICNVCLYYQPDSLLVVWIAISTTCAQLNPPALRSFVYSRFSDSGTWQTSRALRIFTLADTLGYACAPFVGGIFYDIGGLRACAAFAASACSVCAILPLMLPECRQSIRMTMRLKRCRDDAKTIEENANADVASTRDLEERDNTASPNLEKEQLEACGHSVDQKLQDSHASEAATELPPAKSSEPISSVEGNVIEQSRTFAYYGWPVVLTMVATFTNICVYAVEWCLYALYFRLQHGWSGAWCGFAQMIGDLLGASVLGLSTMTCFKRWVKCTDADVTSVGKRFALAVLRPPYSIALLLGCHGVLLVMLAQPQFTISLLGQILMGTVYVFGEQGLQEMLLVYSHSHAFYRRLVFVHYLVFTSGCALCSPLAYGLYGMNGFASAFYSSAAFAFVVGVLFAAYFVQRLALSPAGVLGNLMDAEKHLQQKVVSTISASVHV